MKQSRQKFNGGLKFYKNTDSIDIQNKHKHTPGPWTLQKASYQDYFNIVSKERDSYIGSVNFPEYEKSSDIGSRECEANAALIAAAPEMLEALERTTKLLEAIQRETGYVTLVTQQDNFKLIAKARGEK